MDLPENGQKPPQWKKKRRKIRNIEKEGGWKWRRQKKSIDRKHNNQSRSVLYAQQKSIFYLVFFRLSWQLVASYGWSFSCDRTKYRRKNPVQFSFWHSSEHIKITTKGENRNNFDKMEDEMQNNEENVVGFCRIFSFNYLNFFFLRRTIRFRSQKIWSV